MKNVYRFIMKNRIIPSLVLAMLALNLAFFVYKSHTRKRIDPLPVVELDLIEEHKKPEIIPVESF